MPRFNVTTEFAKLYMNNLAYYATPPATSVKLSTTPHFLRNLQMDPISYSATL
jgi:hypothetical protein